MRDAPNGRVPIVVRGLVLVGMSVLLGVLAHVASGGPGVGFGPLMVTVALVSIAVTAVVTAGAWLGARLPGARAASAAEDASAALALALGQVLVHRLGSPAPPSLNHTATAHLSHHAPIDTALDASIVAAHAGHGTHSGGWPMAVSHVTAALALGLLLRWLEASVMRLSALLRAMSWAGRSVLARWVLGAPIPVLESGSRSRARWDAVERPTVRWVPGTAAWRRGPPLGPATA